MQKNLVTALLTVKELDVLIHDHKVKFNTIPHGGVDVHQHEARIDTLSKLKDSLENLDR